MSKFTAGQAVRITQVTDIDEPVDSPERIIKTDEELTNKGFIDGTKMIGQIARVIDPAINDYYDLTIEIDGEPYAFMEADLEPVEEDVVYTITGIIPAHEHSGVPAFLHGPDTENAVGVTNFKGEPSTVEVKTTSPGVANTLESVYRKVFHGVKVTVGAK